MVTDQSDLSRNTGHASHPFLDKSHSDRAESNRIHVCWIALVFLHRVYDMHCVLTILTITAGCFFVIRFRRSRQTI